MENFEIPVITKGIIMEVSDYEDFPPDSTYKREIMAKDDKLYWGWDENQDIEYWAYVRPVQPKPEVTMSLEEVIQKLEEKEQIKIILK